MNDCELCGRRTSELLLLGECMVCPWCLLHAAGIAGVWDDRPQHGVSGRHDEIVA